MLNRIKSGKPLNFRQRLALTIQLSWPAIIAQLSSIAMQYIDAAMVGRLGADDSASVGLVSTSLWLFWGVCSAMTVGFTVQIAHHLGANDSRGARSILRQGLTASVIFGALIALTGVTIAPVLPGWLGGEDAIRHNASIYFAIFVAALPVLTLNYLGCGALRCAGRMRISGSISVAMCALDVLFNFFLIFPAHEISVGGCSVTLPGAGLGVLGAALGTVLAETVSAALALWFLLYREKDLSIFGSQAGRDRDEAATFRLKKSILKKAFRVSAPMTLEHAVICGAQIAVTVIVAPLGVIAIAANSFAVTAEALCYMPGYGISDAATTLVGQSYGAGRLKLARQFGYLTVGLGMLVMTLMGIALWIFAPFVMSLLTPVEAIASEGASALRIEAWAEPMFAASIVAYGVMVGVGDTIIPAIMNFSSIWLIRLPIAFILAPIYGLQGVWTAMCLELTVRGIIFLYRLIRGSWLKNGLKPVSTPPQCDSGI